MFKNKCIECGRVFDMLDEQDANEWGYGHDCEFDDGDYKLADYESRQFESKANSYLDRYDDRI